MNAEMFPISERRDLISERWGKISERKKGNRQWFV
jgi:hypothetical protein